MTRSQLKQLQVRVVVRLAVGATPHSPAGLADVCGGPCRGGGCIPFLRSTVLCSIVIHLDKLQGEQRQADTLDFPFLSLVPADHASCFSMSFPDTGDLLLSNLVIALSLSCVSQCGWPGAPQLPSLSVLRLPGFLAAAGNPLPAALPG